MCLWTSLLFHTHSACMQHELYGTFEHCDSDVIVLKFPLWTEKRKTTAFSIKALS